MKHPILNLWTYVYPFPACWFFYTYWSEKVNSDFGLYMILVPVLYGYIMPGIAVNIMKKWKFYTPFRLGNYYAHHGFKISSGMNTWFFIASYGLDIGNLSETSAFITLPIAAGAIQGFFTWLNDTHLIKAGKLDLFNNLVNEKMSAEEKAFTYAPLCFFVLGSTFAIAAVFGYNHFQYNDASLVKATLYGFAFVAFSTSMAFNFLEWRKAHQKKLAE